MSSADLTLDSQHRVSPFELADPNKPGHRQFIALWLVDPHKRIISTANVPPQQRSWWTEAVLGDTGKGRAEALSQLPGDFLDLLPVENVDTLSVAKGDAKLPLELKEMIREYHDCNSDSMLMSQKEAEEHRVKLMRERSVHDKASEDSWQDHSYNFCEH
ncbi:hypothetical protein N0V94_005835 [Neodidymelliopsis sp. IMI 364377]|nr:hypothetical protein N0V94_005835 [Neodidymelliopsis sp. IMI 364377]